MAVVHFQTRQEALPAEAILSKLNELAQLAENLRDTDTVFKSLGRLSSLKFSDLHAIQAEWEKWHRQATHLTHLRAYQEIWQRYDAVSRLSMRPTRH